ncbi:MAG: NADH-quinone oxidoreductase subunit D [Dehalococcoidia bacterium]|nr:NADH-quinone oxidoreductase subunit D [Dehalococcoidia bacterium]
MTLATEQFILNIGPLHPSTHGVFRMRVTMDGETIQDVEPVFGYLHRGLEKLCESHTYKQNIPITDRLDYVSAINNNWPYVMAVEKLAEIQVPLRAEYLRVIMGELQRIASHLLAVGSLMNDMGVFYTAFMYMFREREKIIDLLEMVTGQRLLYNYMRFGGVSMDFPAEFIPALKRFLNIMPSYLDEYDSMMADNEILLSRTKGIGILTPEMAVNSSASGPLLRGSGVKWDLRKDAPYSVYDRFDFDIPTGNNGDCYDRYRVRMEEMRQSIRIINQAIEQLPSGKEKVMVPLRIRPPKGETYSQIEAPRGILGCYIVSDGSTKPYRCHFRAPAFINLTLLQELLIGQKLADAIIIFGSIDLSMGEVDR